jgi:hypothetical protein
LEKRKDRNTSRNQLEWQPRVVDHPEMNPLIEQIATWQKRKLVEIQNKQRREGVFETIQEFTRKSIASPPKSMRSNNYSIANKRRSIDVVSKQGKRINLETNHSDMYFAINTASNSNRSISVLPPLTSRRSIH